MPKWIRRIIFWTFVVTFLVLAPLLVLYTAGYRYNLSTGLITRTGVLSITTNPRNVEIYINDEFTQEKTPEVLKRVMPGDYSVELKKDGYHNWSGDIEIISGQTVQLQNVMMFLNTDAELLFDKDTQALAVNPNGELIAYIVREGGWQETWLYLPSENSHTLIDQVVDEQAEIELSWSAQGSYLLAYNTTLNSIELFDQSGANLDSESGIMNAAWHPSSDSSISLITEDGLFRYDIETGDTEHFTQTDETFVLLDASILRLITQKDVVEVAQYVDGEKETLALLPKADYTIEERDGTFLILTDKADQLYLIKIHEDEPILLQEEVRAYDWDEDLDRMVFTDGFELSVYDARAHTTTLITRQSSMIDSVSWHPQSDIIFVQDSALRAFESTAQAEIAYTTTLLENADIHELWIDESGDTAYFYGQQNGTYGVFSLQLSEDVF